MFCLYFPSFDISKMLKRNTILIKYAHMLNWTCSLLFPVWQNKNQFFYFSTAGIMSTFFSHCTQTKIGDILFNIQFCLHIILPRRKTRKWQKKKSKRKIASGFTDNNTVWLTVGRQLDFLRTESQESMMLKFPFSCLCHPSLITMSW